MPRALSTRPMPSESTRFFEQPIVMMWNDFVWVAVTNSPSSPHRWHNLRRIAVGLAGNESMRGSCQRRDSIARIATQAPSPQPAYHVARRRSCRLSSRHRRSMSRTACELQMRELSFPSFHAPIATIDCTDNSTNSAIYAVSMRMRVRAPVGRAWNQ